MNIQGIVIGGIVKGIRSREWDGKIVGYELGLSAQVSDGFGGHTEDLKVIRVNENQHLAVKNAVEKLRGKAALVQVDVTAYAPRNGKPQAQFNYVNDSQIVPLDDVDPFTGEITEKKPADKPTVKVA